MQNVLNHVSDRSSNLTRERRKKLKNFSVRSVALSYDVTNFHQVWSWYDRPLPSYSVFVCWYRTWFGDLDLWPFDLEQLSYMAVHVTNPATSVKTLRLFVHELRVITVPIDYHRKCVCGHCACAESRDQWVGGQNNYIFGIIDPDLPIHYTTFIGLRRRLKVVYSRASPMLSPWLRKFLVRDLVTLTFDRLILNSRRTWRVTWPTLPPRLYDYSFMSYEL